MNESIEVSFINVKSAQVDLWSVCNWPLSHTQTQLQNQQNNQREKTCQLLGLTRKYMQTQPKGRSSPTIMKGGDRSK